MSIRLNLLRAGHGGEPRELDVPQLIVAGWTGRDPAATEAHIAELVAIGVARPAAVPLFYRVAAALVTGSGSIEVVGPDTSGEVEPVVVAIDGEAWLGIGSDHTDRQAERTGVTLAKQLCAKPVSETFWRFSDVAEHWDEVVLRSWATRHGERRLYQEGPAADLLRPESLLEKYQQQAKMAPGAMMFCGTLPVIGPVQCMEHFEMQLDDPILQRSIHHEYAVAVLPVAG